MKFIIGYFLFIILGFILVCLFLKLSEEKRQKLNKFLWLFANPQIKFQFFITLAIFLITLVIFRYEPIFSWGGLFCCWFCGVFVQAIYLTIFQECYKIDLLKIMKDREIEIEKEFFNQ